MKKLFTLLLAVSCFSATYAQSSAEKAKRIIVGERRDYDPNRSGEDNKSIVVGGNRRTVYNDKDYRYESGNRTDIDHEYDSKIRSIRNNSKLSREEKDRIIRGLEAERTRRIRDVNDDYRNDRKHGERSRENSRYEDEKTYKNKKDNKGNNGKHLGWQKGKGNPHNRNSSKNK